MADDKPWEDSQIGQSTIGALLAKVERLTAALQEAHDFLTSGALVTDSQRIANAAVTIADALDGAVT